MVWEASGKLVRGEGVKKGGVANMGKRGAPTFQRARYRFVSFFA